MASVRKEIIVDAPIDAAWDAVRDFGALHQRLVPGFALDARLEGSDRVVTFFDGAVLGERMISRNDDARRMVWSIVDGPWTHHNGSVELVAEAGTTRFIWTTDFLPDDLGPGTEAVVDRAVPVIKRTLEASRTVIDSHGDAGRFPRRRR